MSGLKSYELFDEDFISMFFGFSSSRLLSAESTTPYLGTFSILSALLC